MSILSYPDLAIWSLPILTGCFSPLTPTPLVYLESFQPKLNPCLYQIAELLGVDSVSHFLKPRPAWDMIHPNLISLHFTLFIWFSVCFAAIFSVVT